MRMVSFTHVLFQVISSHSDVRGIREQRSKTTHFILLIKVGHEVKTKVWQYSLKTNAWSENRQ